MNTMFAAMLGGWEIVLILAIVLILFGSKKLPELAKGLGQGIREFKKAAREVTDEVHNADEASSQQRKTVSDAGQSQPGQTVSKSTNPPKS